MHRDQRPVILLDLLLRQCKSCNKRNLEVPLDHSASRLQAKSKAFGLFKPRNMLASLRIQGSQWRRNRVSRVRPDRSRASQGEFPLPARTFTTNRADPPSSMINGYAGEPGHIASHSSYPFADRIPAAPARSTVTARQPARHRNSCASGQRRCRGAGRWLYPHFRASSWYLSK